MQFINQKEDGVQSHIDTLKKQGICLVKNWFTKEEMDKITKELLSIFDEVPDTRNAIVAKEITLSSEEFSQGKDLSIAPSGYAHIPSIVNNIMLNDKINSVLDQYYSKRCQRFMQTFSTMENKIVTDKDLGRHSWIHVDPYAAFKFAFFPYGAKKETGALRVIPESRGEGVAIRENFMSKNPRGINGGIAHRLIDFEEMCPELVSRKESEAVFVECDPLDLVMLDTDMYHGGGAMQEKGRTRIAVYIHNRP